MRAGNVEVDKEAWWYPDFEDEILKFPMGKHDDQVDAFAWVGLKLDKLIEASTAAELEEEEWEEYFADDLFMMGRNAHTGY